MQTPDVAEGTELAAKAISGSNLIAHIVERRLEYLVGTLIAYQMGILDTLVSTGTQCIA